MLNYQLISRGFTLDSQEFMIRLALREYEKFLNRAFTY